MLRSPNVFFVSIEWLRRVAALSLLLGVLNSCTGRDSGSDDDEAVEGEQAGECSDGADNDGDALFDCDDEDCADDPACGGDDDSAGDDDDSGDDDDDDSAAAAADDDDSAGDGDDDDDDDAGDDDADDDDDDAGDDDAGDDDDSSGEDGHPPPGVVWDFADVYSVISSNCSCHLNGGNSGGQALGSTAQEAYDAMYDIPAQRAGINQNRIEPGDSLSSFVMNKIDGTQGASGGAQMPFGQPQLSQETRDGIRGWINAGALNN